MRERFLVLICFIVTCAAANGEAIHDAASRGNLEEVRRFVKLNPDAVHSTDSVYHETPLHSAARNNRQTVVAFLLANGADIDALDGNGLTALYDAVDKNYTDLAVFFVRKGANAKFARTDITNEGLTPLHSAAAHCNKVLAERLLEKGADVNAVDRQKRTVVHVMLGPFNETIPEARRKALIALFVDKGFNVNARDESDDTPLHLAAGRNLPSIVKLLLANKADVNARDRGGATPFGVASKRGYSEVMAALRDAGGTE